MSRKLDLVLVGTGRCATGFYAQFLSSAELKCGHERFFDYRGLDYALTILERYWRGTRAEASWLAAPFLDSEPLKDALVVHLVRHPKQVAESWLRVPEETTPLYWDFAIDHLDGLGHIRNRADQIAFRYVGWNKLIEEKTKGRKCIRFDVAREPLELLYILAKEKLVDMGAVDMDALFGNRQFNTKVGSTPGFWPEHIRDETLRAELDEMMHRYGYSWPDRESIKVAGPERIRVVIASLDNLTILEQQVTLFQEDPLVSEVVVVDNASTDGTREYLADLEPSTLVIRDGHKDPEVQTFQRKQEKPLAVVRWTGTVGAGPARNSGIDAPGKEWDFIQFLDGGIMPLEDGTAQMLDYLQRTPRAHVIGVEIADFRTDLFKAWKRWPEPITRAYQNYRLSHTAYCLARASALDGIRFCEEKPFWDVGWGADDDEMMCRWRAAGVNVMVVTCACKLGLPCSGVHPFRRASGSFATILKQTGIGATDYGSAYEARCVYLGQEWPQYEHNNYWGEPWMTVVIQADSVENTARMVMTAHDTLRKRRFQTPHTDVWNPYSVVVWAPDASAELESWMEAHRLRQHHGTAAFLNGALVRRNGNEVWTGDFRVWKEVPWQGAVRKNAYYYGLAQTEEQVKNLLKRYNDIWPTRYRKMPPPPTREELDSG